MPRALLWNDQSMSSPVVNARQQPGLLPSRRLAELAARRVKAFVSKRLGRLRHDSQREMRVIGQNEKILQIAEQAERSRP